MSLVAAQPSSVHVFNTYITVLIHNNSLEHGHACKLYVRDSLNIIMATGGSEFARHSMG